MNVIFPHDAMVFTFGSLRECRKQTDVLNAKYYAIIPIGRQYYLIAGNKNPMMASFIVELTSNVPQQVESIKEINQGVKVEYDLDVKPYKLYRKGLLHLTFTLPASTRK